MCPLTGSALFPVATLIDIDPVYVRVTSNDRIVIPAAVRKKVRGPGGNQDEVRREEPEPANLTAKTGKINRRRSITSGAASVTDSLIEEGHIEVRASARGSTSAR